MHRPSRSLALLLCCLPPLLAGCAEDLPCRCREGAADLLAPVTDGGAPAADQTPAGERSLPPATEDAGSADAPPSSAPCLPPIPAGAIPVPPGSDLQQAVLDAPAGATLLIEAGTHSLGGPITLKSNLTLRGEAGAILLFTAGEGHPGLVIPAGSTGITIAGLSLDGAGIKGGNDYEQTTDLTIVGNDLTRVAKKVWNGHGPGIFLIRVDNLTVEGNTFHDFADWGLITYSLSRFRIRYNRFINLTQGCHLLNNGADGQFSFNYLTGLERMGAEIQGGKNTKDLTVEGNVIHGWRRAYRDSFGLSIVPDQSINTRVIDNYVRGDFGPGGTWHPETQIDSQGERFGYGIEYGAFSGEIRGNVVGSESWANHIIVSGAGGAHPNPVPATDNQLFGAPLWDGYVTTEAAGKPPTQQNNLTDPVFSHMPPVPPPPQPGCSG